MNSDVENGPGTYAINKGISLGQVEIDRGNAQNNSVTCKKALVMTTIAPRKPQEWASEADSQARIDKIKTKEAHKGSTFNEKARTT